MYCLRVLEATSPRARCLRVVPPEGWERDLCPAPPWLVIGFFPCASSWQPPPECTCMRKKSEHRQAGHLADGVRARPVSWLPLQCADQCIVLFSLLQALAFHQEVNPEPHYQKSLWERALIKNWHSLILELSIPQKRLFMRTSHLQNIRVGSNTFQSSSLTSWLLPPPLTTVPCPSQT